MNNRVNLVQEKKTLKILINGTYYSGSSALVDFCRGLKNSTTYPGEFLDFRSAGLVGDLAAPENTGIGESLIKRYLQSNGNISYLYPTSRWLQYSKVLHELRWFILDLVSKWSPSIVRQKLMKNTSMLCLNKFYKAIHNRTDIDHIVQQAIVWQNCLTNNIASGSDYVIFDQPIYLTKHFHIWPLVFDPVRLIVMVRDPRDQIADMVKRGKVFNDFNRCGTNGISDIFGSNLEGAVNYHLKRLEIQYERILFLKKMLPANKFMVVPFECFVQDFSVTTKKVLKFIGNENQAADFDPDQSKFKLSESKNNIGIYLQFPEITTIVERSVTVMGYYSQLAKQFNNNL
ncbi:sulfotransferase [Candidatus Pelagibacter bacterium]|nr:sulfotransferase domain-containing protein [Candidatus Pelagibacter bacterium]MDA8844913.1 sulfotransferase [Candidatus Pelagibacter bacterium]